MRRSRITGQRGLPTEQSDGSGTVAYYLQDQLGSTRGLIDSSGNVVGEYTFDAWGNVQGQWGASTPFGYAGQYTDAESGLQYLQNRYYDPGTAQFITVDPLEPVTHQPYAYVSDNPLNATDPAGLCSCSRNPLLAVWNWVSGHAGTIGVIAAGLAVLAAIVFGPEVVSLIFAVAGVVTGVIAAAVDVVHGNYLAAAFDVVGVLFGGVSFELLFDALRFTGRIEEFIRLYKEGKASKYLYSAIYSMGTKDWLDNTSQRLAWLSGSAATVAKIASRLVPGAGSAQAILRKAGAC